MWNTASSSEGHRPGGPGRASGTKTLASLPARLVLNGTPDRLRHSSLAHKAPMGRRRGSQRHADSSLCARLPAAQVTTAGGAAVITMENKTVDAPVQRTDGAQAWLGGGSNARGGACSGAPGAACAVCTCPAGAVDVPLPAPRWLGPVPPQAGPLATPPLLQGRCGT